MKPRRAVRRRKTSKTDESQWAYVLQRWARPESAIKGHEVLRLADKARARGLSAGDLAELLSAWEGERIDPPPADLHELEEVLVA